MKKRKCIIHVLQALLHFTFIILHFTLFQFEDESVNCNSKHANKTGTSLV